MIFVRVILNVFYGRNLTNEINFLVLIFTAWAETFYFYYGIINIWDRECVELGYLNFWALYIILHCLPAALIVTLISGVIVCCCPVLTVYVYRTSKERAANQRMRERLANYIPFVKFNNQTFNNFEECIICMEKFDDNSQVTPLPCDVRHYFHTHCIQDWFKQ